MRKRGARKVGRPPMTQVERVISAVRRGAQDARAISRMGRVPIKHVHPILSRLRSVGRMRGFTGNLEVIE